MKVLYLSVWYPSDRDRMAGLFVQKHVEAVRAQGAEVRVNTFWPQADLVQLNVLTLKWGLLALLMKCLLHIPYILVEHWSGYLPQNGQFERFPLWKQSLLRCIAKNASAIYPVSQLLADNMRRCGIQNPNWGHIDNVVDDFFYTKNTRDSRNTEGILTVPPHTEGEFRLLHVSCFDESSKNVRSLLRAFKSLITPPYEGGAGGESSGGEASEGGASEGGAGGESSLTLVGTGPDWQACRDYARELAIPDNRLTWTGEVSPQEVCRHLQQSDCLVLASRYETYGIPLAEALATGTPVIETQTCGIQVPPTCGLSIPPDNDQALTDALRHMLLHHQDYNKKDLQQEAQKYHATTVGQQLMKIYTEYGR